MFNSDPPGTRTRNLLLRRQLLYPIELADHFSVIFKLDVNLFGFCLTHTSAFRRIFMMGFTDLSSYQSKRFFD